MGVIAEKFSDGKGLVWPENIAPARVYIARLGDKAEVVRLADELYDQLQKQNVTCLYDDRDVRPGQKFADADLLGIPYRVVISEKTLETSKYELKKRPESEPTMMNIEEIIKVFVK